MTEGGGCHDGMDITRAAREDDHMSIWEFGKEGFNDFDIMILTAGGPFTAYWWLPSSAMAAVRAREFAGASRGTSTA